MTDITGWGDKAEAETETILMDEIERAKRTERNLNALEQEK